ncbi:hypothetical protein [Bacteriophage sp.]|nr:hypothetical protein [Bacteriophage sp.]UOF80116.1 hypothetical protein [Bacteriophage sp.]
MLFALVALTVITLTLVGAIVYLGKKAIEFLETNGRIGPTVAIEKLRLEGEAGHNATMAALKEREVALKEIELRAKVTMMEAQQHAINGIMGD